MVLGDDRDGGRPSELSRVSISTQYWSNFRPLKATIVDRVGQFPTADNRVSLSRERVTAYNPMRLQFFSAPFDQAVASSTCTTINIHEPD
jgi:hypothetical protein